MSEADCPFCPMVAELETAETYRSPSGVVSRRVALLPTSVAVIGHDQYYPGYTLVIARRHARELYHLPDAESTAYFQDMLRVARAVDRAFSPRKMNYELLGNTVEHLHWHVLPRYAGDPDPSRPTWLNAHLVERPRSDAARRRRVRRHDRGRPAPPRLTGGPARRPFRAPRHFSHWRTS